LIQIYKRYIDLLLSYNKTHKLSGVKSENDVKEHILDSLYPQNFLDFSQIQSVMDIGTGAGFPGMVLAIYFKDIEFTLVEPLQKRVAFLHLVKSRYDLKNVTIIKDRIENIKPFKVDLITSRAVTDTKELLTLANSFIDKDTKLLFYKGSSIDEELPSDLNYKIYPRGEKRNYLLINS